MADETAEKLDKIAGHLDSLHKRMDESDKERADSVKQIADCMSKMDSWDKSRKDAAEKEEEEKKKADAAKADAAKKDAEEEEKKKADAVKADAAKKDAEEEEKKKADAAKADAANGDVAKMLAELATFRSMLPAQLTPEAKLAMVNHQVKANQVAQAFGDSAGAPACVNGESERDYTIRLMTPYLKYSKRWKDKKLEGINDSVLGEIEAEVYNDAMAETVRPTQFQKGVLIPTKQTDAANRVSTRYVGDANACWDQFNPPIRHVRRLLTPGSNRVQ